jgi:SAM-dependent methyltransferase
MAHPDWNDSYAGETPPWDVGEPDPHLMKAVKEGLIQPGKALEVGCGTGTNAIWMAQQGFEVLGVDIAPRAIEKARAKAKGLKNLRFEVVDFLGGGEVGSGYAFAYDRGCFHVFDEAAERTRFAQRLSSVLAPRGQWLSLIGSTEGAPREFGPPRRTLRDVTQAVEPFLEFVRVTSVEFDAMGTAFKAWLCLMRQREVPASPSSQRD